MRYGAPMAAPDPREPRHPSYLALCPRPTEPLVAAELAALPEVLDVQPGAGAVSFRGPQAALYRANLWLRCATRVLVPLSDRPCGGAADLYAQARELPWEEYLQPRGTLAVSAHGELPGLGNSMFTAQKVKDAIVDRFRDRKGLRPDVDPADPDLLVNVQLYKEGGGRCALALDSSGPALHRRGYRQDAATAPLKETLAAALVALSDYGAGPEEEQRPLLDLCCGGGTLVIEGGLRALRRAPGLLRSFGFQRWRGFDAALWEGLLAEARQGALPAPARPRFHGSDIDRRMVEGARRNAGRAGLGSGAVFAQQDLRTAVPPPAPPGVVLCNPPYGERLGEGADLVSLYRALGDTLKRHFAGYRACVFTTNLALGRQIGLRPAQRHVLYNGSLEGRLLCFDLY